MRYTNRCLPFTFTVTNLLEGSVILEILVSAAKHFSLFSQPQISTITGSFFEMDYIQFMLCTLMLVQWYGHSLWIGARWM